MGDHTESFQVDFDPHTVSYEDLLELFWTTHDPTQSAWKTQYASLVLAHDEMQLDAAKDGAERLELTLGRRIATGIEPLQDFWPAEDYHQKYYLRNDRKLMREFERFYSSEHDFRESTAAARVNGFLLGSAGCLGLERELPGLGLSGDAEEYLREICGR